jgi:hypothetical protein
VYEYELVHEVVYDTVHEVVPVYDQLVVHEVV